MKLSAESLFKTEAGWYGHFTRVQAMEAAHPNGARITKAVFEKGDTTPIGVEGVVLGSMFIPERGVGYFVEWDNKPRVAVFVVEAKIK